MGGREGKVCDEAEVPGGSLVHIAVLSGQEVEEKGQPPGVSPEIRSFLGRSEACNVQRNISVVTDLACIMSHGH